MIPKMGIIISHQKTDVLNIFQIPIIQILKISNSKLNVPNYKKNWISNSEIRARKNNRKFQLKENLERHRILGHKKTWNKKPNDQFTR